MIALITGASSGIGEEFAKNLASRGFDLILVARRAERLKEIKKKLTDFFDVRVKLICLDVSKAEHCKRLYEKVKTFRIDLLINNAGFGLFGKFDQTDLDRELEMIDVNIKAVHILTKLFLRDFKRRGCGYILNVSSIAGFMAGPLMATYYASKNYVTQLTRAISQELKHDKINVYIGVLCPGPVNTEFNRVAGAEFAMGGATAAEIAEYGIEEMLKGKTVIVPKKEIKALALLSKALPSKFMLWGTYFAQTARRGDPSEE
ncbi:MAG: SDR family oxidoreductase [Bacteroides sp.]|nr:SDR family oxidoreductase [Bacteroides sp.]